MNNSAIYNLQCKLFTDNYALVSKNIINVCIILVSFGIVFCLATLYDGYKHVIMIYWL